MGYTIREITSGWSVIDYPAFFKELETAIYNAKEWSKESRRSMFFIIDDCGNAMNADGLTLEEAEYYKGELSPNEVNGFELAER